MIGRLRGIIDVVEDDHIILDVGGVGYLVFCSGNALRKLPEKGAEVSFFIETHVREDHFHLYGFLDKAEQEWFLTLNGVQGVGTRMAMAILSAMTPQQIINALVLQDKAAFKAISGVGPKLSERLITELKSKVKNMQAETLSPAATKALSGSASTHDAISALINLGYSRGEAYNVISRISGKNEKLEVSELIREGLKELAR